MSGDLHVPAWQTDDLVEEWPDEDDELDDDDDHTRSISLTTPLASHLHTNSQLDLDPQSPQPTHTAVGTFLVHQDAANVPILPKTPGKLKRGNIKDFFSPLPLERMFEPPSPPLVAQPEPRVESQSPLDPPEHPASSENSDEILETDLPNMKSFEGRKPSLTCQFTFAAPRTSTLQPPAQSTTSPMAQSTPIPPQGQPGTAPLTDPRLRLFQFQYDTFTRDHLSAMVDSIAINTPSGSTPSPDTNRRLSTVSEVTGSNASFSQFRSTKRVKLSPASDYDQPMFRITRPRMVGKDFVGASDFLMQQIKKARDLSTISTVASLVDTHQSRDKTPPAQGSPTDDSGSTASDSTVEAPTPPSKNQNRGYSSNKFRLQAESLMAQIKSDLKGQKRVFSGESEAYSDTVQSETVERSHYSHSRHSSQDKENRDDKPQMRRSLTRSQSGKLKPRPSPGRFHPNLAVGHRPFDLVAAVSQLNVHEPASALVQPIVNHLRVERPQHPFFLQGSQLSRSSSRQGNTEDLNRFVSSSTASGTTLTAGSVQSYVKHPGPPQIRTIAPSDVPVLPEKFGNMIFDKDMMKWVKNTAQAISQDLDDHLPPDEPSEDPFEDIESLRDDSSSHDPAAPPDDRWQDLSRVEEQTEETDDEEEMELTSFETDDPTGRMVPVMTGIDSDGETTDSEDIPNDVLEGVQLEDQLEFDSEEEPLSPETPPADPLASVPSRHLSVDATPVQGTTPTGTPMRSALKSRNATPASRRDVVYQTPMRQRGHRRSVSFSDGKRDGPIRGLSRDLDASDSAAQLDHTNSGVPSARSKRIADLMEALDGSDIESDDDSPSKTMSSAGRPEELLRLSERKAPDTPGTLDRRVFSRAQTYRPSPASSSKHGNATFLTECSFGVAHDRLVQVITDVDPFEPHWEELTSIDLSGKEIDSAARLKEFLPKLDTLSLNSNQLSWLSGVPGSVRTLSVASNSLTSLTSFQHIPNLVSLDISNNDIDSIRQLQCLRHLRELRADRNKIRSIEGLESMSSLVKLSLVGNALRSVDLSKCRWTRLEMLDLSHNRIDDMSGLSTLSSLIALNFDDNAVPTLDLEVPMPKLKILKASSNRLSKLNLALVPNLRTLYLDNNSLVGLAKLDRLTKLENLSIRNQGGKGLNLLTRDVRDAKRLYLSGNPLGNAFLSEACYQLVYVEMAGCRLTNLPRGLASLIPNVRVLNLNYNFLEDVGPLEGLTRLRKLTVIGSRLKGTKALIRLLQGMPDMEMLDFRMNPCTLGWYLPLLVKDVPGALQPSERHGEMVAGWLELDSKFRRDLPDDVYTGRLAYRGLIMGACPGIRLVDGIEVTEKERAKAQRLLAGLGKKVGRLKG